jgi:hypothetical protein
MTDSTAPKNSKAIVTKPTTAAAVKKPAINKPIPNKPTVSRSRTSTAAKSATTKASTVKKPAVATTTNKPVSVATKTATVTSKPAVASKTVSAKPAASPAKVAAKPAVKTKAVAPKKEAKKDDKKHKPEKVKMERDSFTMPKDEYAQLSQLKSRLTAMGHPVKKSELLRAGIKLLANMSDVALKSTMAEIPVIKTGRPKK